MTTITLAELENNFEKYISLAATEDIIITMDGKVAAKLSGPYIPKTIRDQPEKTADMRILSDMPLSAILEETVEGYRNRHSACKPGNLSVNLPYEEYLQQLGAAAISSVDGKLHPTAAGLLMFGKESSITQEYPEYSLNYIEMLDPMILWTDRLQSSSGEWSGNVFDFYFDVYNRLIKVLKVPFRIEGGIRIDDTPMHKAVREALLNCLVNADFSLPGGVVIKLDPDKMVMENPGSARPGKHQMLRGNISDPRNKTLMKMFNVINIGGKVGSEIPDIFTVWKNEGLPAPEVIEELDPDRTILSLIVTKEQDRITYRMTNTVTDAEKLVLDLIAQDPNLSYAQMADKLSVSRKTISTRIRSLKEKGIIERVGSDRNGYWKLNN